MFLRYYWGMGIGHTYAHAKLTGTTENSESHGGSIESVAEAPRHTSTSPEHEDDLAPGSDAEGGWEDFEDSHSSGESDTEVSSSSDDEVLEMYYGSDAELDLMDVDEYL